jgi:hypothetical protein
MVVMVPRPTMSPYIFRFTISLNSPWTENLGQIGSEPDLSSWFYLCVELEPTPRT